MTIPTQPMDSAAPMSVVPLQCLGTTIPQEVVEEVARLGLAEQFPDVVELTREIFGDFEITIAEDPEIPNCSYVSFDVEVAGTIDDAVRQGREWHQRLPRCPAQSSGSFCLPIHIA